jgi:hypothetical protein
MRIMQALRAAEVALTEVERKLAEAKAKLRSAQIDYMGLENELKVLRKARKQPGENGETDTGGGAK